MSTRRSAGPAGLVVAPPHPSPAPGGGIGSGRGSESAPAPELSGQNASAGGTAARPGVGAAGGAGGGPRASPASSLASAGSVASSNASATSGSPRVVTASRRGRGMRLGDRAAACRSPSPTGSGNLSALPSPTASGATAIAQQKPAPSSGDVDGGGPTTKSGCGAGTSGPHANGSDVVGTGVKVEEKTASDGEVEKATKATSASTHTTGITIGEGSASPVLSRSPKARGSNQVDPHDQRTPKHNHLSARSNGHGPRQEADRPPSPIQGPSSAAAAAAAAAKALRSGQGMMRTPSKSDNKSAPESKASTNKHPQPPSHHPHLFPYGGYQPHAIPHSPDDNAAAAAAYYAHMYGHNPYGGYYNHDMTTNWPDESEGSERGESADSDDRGTKKAAKAAYRHFDERDRAYLQYHRQHQLRQPPHYNYQHHSDHHQGFSHHPGDGSGYRPPSHVAREYVAPDERVGGPAADEGSGGSKRGNGSTSPKNRTKNNGKVVMGGASPIHVARGMSTSPLAQNNTLAPGRHVTPHSHNTRHSSRQKIKKEEEEEEEEEEESKQSPSTSSIFRGRPAPSMNSRAADDFDNDDEDSPQQILLSLSKGDSFEDRGFVASGGSGTVQVIGGEGVGVDSAKSNNGSSSAAALTDGGGSAKKAPAKGGAKEKTAKKKGKAIAGSSGKSSPAGAKKSKPPSRRSAPKGNGKPPTSPDEPPRIQHSFSQNTKRGNDPFYFDPMRTPSGKVAMLDPQGPMIDNAPSFAPFFNTSFDYSLGDPSKIAMSMSGGLGISPSFSFGLGVTNTQGTNPDDGGRFGPYPMPNNSLRLSFGPSHSFGDQQPMPVGGDSSKTLVLGGDPNAGMRNVADAAAIVLSGTSSAGSSKRSAISSVKEFYDVLRSHRMAFTECAFLLPGLKEVLAQTNEVTEEDESNDGAMTVPSASGQLPVRNGSDSPDRGAGGYTTEQPTARVISVGVTPARAQSARSNSPGRRTVSDAVIARRRVKSAICAFGGAGYAIPSGVKDEDSSTDTGVGANNSSIFRTKKREDTSFGAARSTTLKSEDSAGEGPNSDERKNYDAKLLARFYENNNRLTWEVEEEPPVSSPPPKERSSKKRNHPGAQDASDRDGKKSRLQNGLSSADSATASGKSPLSAGVASTNSPEGKMKYRCKLCGQPKQNHVCPYKKSLQRSIGTMAYSAVNAYNAEEPGHLAPALSTMNNFVSQSSSVASTPPRGGPKSHRLLHPGSVERKLAHITPQSVRVGTTSPGGSSLSTLESPPRGRALPPRSSGSGSRRMRFPSIAPSGSSLSGGGNFLFAEVLELRPGQFRAVAPLPKTEDTPYQYASLPLPYGQRKKLSDKLFSISKEVPNLTDECAHVLREAREKDMWDRAIAELLAQILAVLDCSPDDRKLEGIRRHLLFHYGIAC